MNSSINCGIKGSYQVQLKSGGKVVEETPWFSNDITNAGLNYPFIYSFANCFMFLSLGGSAWVYSSLRQQNTGTNSPIQSFQVYDPTFTGNAQQPNATGYYQHTGQYIGWEGYEIGGQHNSTFAGSFSSTCGTKFTNQGINLYRGWTIPTGANENGAVLGQALTINGFMVSPSSGANITGNQAFSLVDRTVTIPSGFTATITYQLSLNFNNYQTYTYFSGVQGDSNGYFNTGNAAIGTNGSELGLLSGWSNLSGIYSQIYPGVQIVDSLGACIIPAWGDQAEPMYSQCPNLYFYLSPDISEFAVSPYGSTGISESGAYNTPGVMANYTEFVSSVGGDLSVYSTVENSWPANPVAWYYSGLSNGGSQSNGPSTVTSVTIPSNIRLQNLLSIQDYINDSPISPSAFTYQVQGYVSPITSQEPVAFATPGSLGINSSYANYGQRAVYSTYLKRLPPTGSTLTGVGGVGIRNKKVTKSALFSPIQSAGTNSRYGSLVLGYLSAVGTIGSLTFQPYVDFLFFNNSGRAADTPHYRLIPDICLTDRGSGVSQVRFDITGANGLAPSSINNLYNVYGFMGPGVAITPTTASGLDINHPELQAGGSGYLFTGEILNQGVTGMENCNGGTGWGAVYGIITGWNFLGREYDTCLIDNTPWYTTGFSGFSGSYGVGTYPNPTGDSNLLYWPVKGSGLGLRITGMQYYLNGYGNMSDPFDYFITGNYQIISDIIYTGFALTGTNAVTTDLYQYTGNSNLIYFSGAGTSDFPLNISDITGNLSLQYNITGKSYNFQIATGLGANPVRFSGFKIQTGTWGYEQNWTPANILASTGNSIVGKDTSNHNITLVYFDGYNYWPLTGNANFSLLPTQFKKPSGVIHHVENINGSGNRLLPNYAYPNNQGINYYSPVQGGAYPGLSMQNGMQVFFDFNWSGG